MSAIANLVTSLRLFLQIILLYILFLPTPFWIWTCFAVGFFMYHMDILDGWIARRFNCASELGGMYDTAVDKITEFSMLLVWSYLGWLPIWMPLFFIIRGSLIDMLKLNAKLTHREHYSALGYFIVKSTFSKTFYGAIKGWLSGWIAIMRIIQISYPILWANHFHTYLFINNILICGAVLTAIIRAVPVCMLYFRKNKASINQLVDNSYCSK